MQEELKFFDLKTKKSFITGEYKLEARKNKRGTTYFAIAVAPSGIKAFRIVSKAFYEEFS